MSRQPIEKRKYPAGSGGRIDAIPLVEDNHGSWFFAPAGDGNCHERSGVLLLPRDAWWVAWWWQDDDSTCTVDVATPHRLEDGVLVYDDLEIDLWMTESNPVVGVVDLDEFAEAVLAVPYPAEMIEHAINAMRDVEARMVDRRAPFDCGFTRLRDAVRTATIESAP